MRIVNGSLGARNAPALAVVVASRRRPDELAMLLEHLARQTQPARQILIALSDLQDAPSATPAGLQVEILLAAPGSCRQRNAALDRVDWDRTDYVVFFDDDYFPTRTALADIAQFFADHPEVSGINGRLIADGATSGGLPAAEACKLVQRAEALATPPLAMWSRDGLYGCNMAFRAGAVETVRFDEALPLYGWQEDVDFAARRRFGALAMTTAFQGVHCGARGGRTSGVRFGYSQIANPSYLRAKGSISSREARRLIVRAILANLWRFFRPEPWIDRIGRTRGNFIAMTDRLRGRLRPDRILDLG